MTLFDLIAVLGTVELVALVAILAALVWPQADRSGAGIARGVPGRTRTVRTGGARAVTGHPLVPPTPQGESAPGG